MSGWKMGAGATGGGAHRWRVLAAAVVLTGSGVFGAAVSARALTPNVCNPTPTTTTISTNTTWTSNQEVCNLIVNSGVTLAVTQNAYLLVDGALTLNGTLTFAGATPGSQVFLRFGKDANIAAGGILTVGPSTAIVLDTRVSIFNSGTVRLNGSSAAVSTPEEIFVERTLPSDASTTWGGVFSLPGSTLYMLHAIVQGGGNPSTQPPSVGATAGSQVGCNDCALAMHESAVTGGAARGIGVDGTASQVLLDRVTSTHNGGSGVHVRNTAFTRVWASTFSDNAAPDLFDGGTADVENSVFFHGVGVGSLPGSIGRYTFVLDDILGGLGSAGNGAFDAESGIVTVAASIVEGDVYWSEPATPTTQHLTVGTSGTVYNPGSTVYHGSFTPPWNGTSGSPNNGHNFQTLTWITGTQVDPQFICCAPGTLALASNDDLHIKGAAPIVGGPYGYAGTSLPTFYPAMLTESAITPASPATAGTPVTLTAHLTLNPADLPTGTVRFLKTTSCTTYNQTSPVLATAIPDASGAATVTTTQMPLGTYCVDADATTTTDPVFFATLNAPPPFPQYTVNTGPLDHITVTPSSGNITAGGSQTYQVEGYDSANDDLGDVTVNSHFTISGGGACTDATSTTPASCTATAQGVHTISATDGAVTGGASLTVSPAALDHLQLSPATTNVTVGSSQAYTAEGFDAYGNSLGDVTAATTFAMDGTTCPGQACTPASVGTHTITGSDSGASGNATLTATAVSVSISTVGVTANPPNTAIRFGDSVTVGATVARSSTCCGDLTGTLTFTINGAPSAGVSVPVSLTSGVTSAQFTATIRLDQGVLPGGAGTYPVAAVFTSTASNYAGANGSSTVAVAPDTATSIWPLDFAMYSTQQQPSFAVAVDQRAFTGDSETIDFNSLPVWVRFDVVDSNNVVQRTYFTSLSDAADWSTTGLGGGGLTSNVALAAGTYTVRVNLVSGSGAPASSPSPFLSAPELDGVLVVTTPSSTAVASGKGTIAVDSSANTTNTAGHFNYSVTSPGGTPTGTATYSWKQAMLVNGHSRTVVVTVSSTGIRYLGVTKVSGGHATTVDGACSVTFVDAVTHVVYSQFGFTGGSFELVGVDAGATESLDRFGIAVRDPDGMLFHVSTAPFSPTSGSPAESALASGDVRGHL